MTPRFINALHEAAGVATDTIFTLPVSWDPAHFLNLAFNDARKDKDASSYFASFVDRCKVFTTEFGRGKGYAELEAVASFHELKKKTPLSFAPQRFASSALKEFLAIEDGYTAFCKTFIKVNPNLVDHEQNQYKIMGQDFVFDLLCILDIMQPLSIVMIELQALDTPVWKAPIYISKLIKYLQSIIFATNSSDCLNCPNLEASVDQVIIDNKFKEINLLEGWLVTNDAGPDNTGKAGKSGKSAPSNPTWVCKEVHEYSQDPMTFKMKLSDALTRRLENCVCPASNSLAKCLDLPTYMNLLCG